MTDIRDRLNVRRDHLLTRLDHADFTLKSGMGTESERDVARAIIDELAATESTLATMQLADAQREVAMAQRDVADAQRDDTAARADAQASAEDMTFWSRRFVTTLTVAHAAGFLSTLLFLTRADSPTVPMGALKGILFAFAFGMILGGLYPIMRVFTARIFSRRLPGDRASATVEFAWVGFMVGLLTYGLLATTGTALSTYRATIATRTTVASTLPPVVAPQPDATPNR